MLRDKERFRNKIEKEKERCGVRGTEGGREREQNQHNVDIMANRKCVIHLLVEIKDAWKKTVREGEVTLR